MSRVVLVDVDMDVTFSMMFVFMRVDIVFERPAQRPKANTEKHYPDNPVTP